MKHRLAFCLSIAALAAPLPALAQAPTTSGTSAQNERDTRASVLSSCSLKAWQFSVRITPGGEIVPSMSPSLSRQQKMCVQQTLTQIAANNS